MKSSLHSFFQSLPEAELPVGLSERIFAEIGRLQEHEIRRALLFSRIRVGVSGAVSLGAIFFAGSLILGSEFMRLCSLVISDTAVVAAYGRELFWLLLETFPTIPFVLLLAPFFFFLLSLGMHMTTKRHSLFSHMLSV